MAERKRRPKQLEGKTVKIETGCGSLYVTINSLEDKPIEIFTKLGKAGSCVSCQLEGVGRAISLGLKHGVPLEEYVEQLEYIRCNNPHMYPEEERTLSCSDAIAKVLKGIEGEKK